MTYVCVGSVTFLSSVLPGSGKFEITESGSLVASGIISVASNPVKPSVSVWTGFDDQGAHGLDRDLTQADIYKELRLRGYDYGSSFQGILSASSTGVMIVG